MVLQGYCRKLLSTIARHGPYHHINRGTFQHVRNCRVSNVANGFDWLVDCAPSFYVDGNNVKVLKEPSEFYNLLKANICEAKERITLASLYLGTGSLEQDLVSCIDDRLCHAKEINSNLKVWILLDHARGSRGESNTSRTMLLPLLQKFPEAVNFSFYHNPQLRGPLRWITPQKFNETIGVSHLKVYLTDNSFIISGANLSNDYFTNRQDRYICVKNSPNVADYFHDLVKTVSSFSLQLHDNNTTTFDTRRFSAHPYKEWDKGKRFKHSARTLVQEFTKKWTEKTRSNVSQGDTLVFPLLQMGPFGITQDEEVTLRIFENAPKGSLSHLATGYFNLTSSYLNQILTSKGRYLVLCAHPLANGFYKAGGIIDLAAVDYDMDTLYIGKVANLTTERGETYFQYKMDGNKGKVKKGGIPDAFTQFAKEFYNKINKCGQGERITLKEYFRSQWTFHAKGLWYSPPREDLPNMTLIGSPNFGHRSLKRDLENQTVLITSNFGLRRQLYNECAHVYEYGEHVTHDTFAHTTRKVPLWARVVSGFTRSFF